MSISSIDGYANWWLWRSQSSQSSTASNTTTPASGSSTGISNTGSPIAQSNLSSFLKAFSADLQSLLTQQAATSTTSDSSSPATAATASSSTDQATTDQASRVKHHHHHHHHAGGETGTMETAANQLVDEIGQSLQGTLSTDQINQSASAFAADVASALQSYGTTASTGTAGSSVLV